MTDKHIADLIEDTAPVDTSDMIIQQPSGGLTRKAKLVNLLKNVFSTKDVYNDYLVGLDFETGGGNAKPILTVFRGGIYLWAFSGASGIDEGYFMMHLKHDFKAGQAPTLHVHWSHIEPNPVGNVKWNIEYSIGRGYGGTFSAPVTMSVVQAAGPQYSHHITDDNAMIIPASADLEPDTLIIGRLYRDASDAQDTFASNAYFINCDMHYVANRVGTTERNRPFTSGGF